MFDFLLPLHVKLSGKNPYHNLSQARFNFHTDNVIAGLWECKKSSFWGNVSSDDHQESCRYSKNEI